MVNIKFRRKMRVGILYETIHGTCVLQCSFSMSRKLGSSYTPLKKANQKWITLIG
jgi:hypothetical protein